MTSSYPAATNRADFGRGLAGAPPAALRTLGAAFLAERERWLLWSPVLLGIGIALYFALPAEPPAWLGAIAVAAAALTAWTLRRSTGWRLAGLAALLLASGFLLAELRTRLVAAPVLEKRLGPVSLDGRLAEVATLEDGWRLTVEAIEIADLPAARTPRRIRVSLKRPPPPLAVGDRVRLRAILMPPPGPAAPGAFDYARQAWFERLGGVGFAVGAVRRLDGDSGWSAALAVGRWRQGLSARIRALLPGSTGTIAAALMTGDRSAIAETDWKAMRDSGLAHLLAISGLHIGLVASLLFFGLRAVLAAAEGIALRWPIKKWAAVTAAVGAFAYLELTGATVPTQRAFLMVALVLLAVLTERAVLSMRLLAWAALAILALTPESLLSVSFQMSFGAVVALIAAYESLGPRLAAWRRQGGPLRLAALYLAGVAVTTLVAGLATAPFAAYHFNQASHYSLAANLLAVPLTALWIMPWAVIAYLLLPFGLDGLALAPMGAGIDAMLWVAATVAGWPGAVSRPASPGPAALALVVLGGLWLCLWCGRWRWFGSIVVAAGIGLGAGARPPDMLIDGEGRLAAVLTASGGLDFSRATNGYESETWLRRVGMFEAAAAGSFVCDRLGCIATRQGITIAYVGDARALEEDCRRADIVLSAVPVRRRCPSARLVIDRFDLWREGAHAVWLDGTALTVRTAAELRGNRPWSPARGAARWRRQS